MEKIYDDIYLIPMEIPFKATPLLSLYYLDGDKPALIDTGLGDPLSVEFISSELKGIGRSLENLSIIINTHEHTEHFAGNKKLKSASGATIIASSTAAPFIENYHGYMLKIREKLNQRNPGVYTFLERMIIYA